MSKRPRIHVGRCDANATRGPREDGRYYWQARVWIGGDAERETKCIGWHTEDEAIKDLARRVAAGSLDAEQPVAPTEETIRSLLDLYMKARKKAKLSPLTLRNNQTAATALTEAVGSVVLERLTLETLEGYRDSALRDGTTRSSTVRFYLRVLKQAWKWGTEHGLLDAPWPRVRVLDIGDAKEKPIADIDDMESVERFMRERWPEGWAWRCFHIIRTTGARPGEVAKLTVGDVDLDAAELKIRQKRSPGKKPVRVFPLLDDTLEMLREWVADRGSAALLWGPSPKAVYTSMTGDHMPGAFEKLEIAAVSPYAMRRAAVRSMIRGGVPIKVAAELTGHSPEQLLRDYEQALPEDLREAVAKARIGRPKDGKVVQFKGRRKP